MKRNQKLLGVLICFWGSGGFASTIPAGETLVIRQGKSAFQIKAAIDKRLAWGVVVCFELPKDPSGNSLSTGDLPDLVDKLNASTIAKRALFAAHFPDGHLEFGDGTEEVIDANVGRGHLDTITQPKPFTSISIKFDRANNRGWDYTTIFPCNSQSFEPGQPLRAIRVAPPKL
jgi:hypothetical protein